MTTIVLGDTHGRSFWKYIFEKEKPNRVIFIGDYFDSFDISCVHQIHNFKEIIAYAEDNPEVECVFLIGNHDHHYFEAVGYSGTSGYQEGGRPMLIRQVLEEHKAKLQMAYMLDERILFTHAGVSETWLEQVGFGEVTDKNIKEIAEFVNDVWKHKPLAFLFESYDGRADSSGNNIWQSPIWIRPRSLMQDSQIIKKHLIQVAGHTQMTQIDTKGKATGGRYYFIDTLATSGQYMVIENERIKFHTI